MNTEPNNSILDKLDASLSAAAEDDAATSCVVEGGVPDACDLDAPKRNRPPRKRHYVGKLLDNTGELLYLGREERAATEGKYVSLLGPFRTLGIAQFTIDHLLNNENVKCAADATRLYKRQRELDQRE